MSVEISWRQPRRVIYERFYDTVTIEELTSIQQTFFHYLSEGDAPVHSIIDMAAVHSFPKSLNQIRQALTPDPTGKGGSVVIVTGGNPVLKFVTSMISQVLFRQAQFTFCATLDEAVSYLRQRDPTVILERIDSSSL